MESSIVMRHSTLRTGWLTVCTLAAISALTGIAWSTSGPQDEEANATETAPIADEHEYLGALSLLTDPDVRGSLQLTEESEAELVGLLEQRRAAARAAEAEWNELTPTERQQRKRDFAAESETLGMELLSDAQRADLRLWSIAARGMASLGDAYVADQLGLNGEQVTKIAGLLDERAAELANATGVQKSMIRNRYELELSKVLTSTQFAGWRIMAGDVPAANEAAPVELASQQEPAEGSSDETADDSSDDGEEIAQESIDEASTAEDSDTTSSATQDDSPAATSSQDAIMQRPIKFTFGQTEWTPILEWFADQAGFSLQMDDPPPGSFNYYDDSEYTVAEALDQINHVLLTRGFTLVRNNKMLMLVDMADGIPEAVIETVTPELLDNRGKYEVIRCMYELTYVSGDTVRDQIRPLIEDDEYGKFWVVPSANRVVVQGTGDKLRMIRDMINAAEKKSELEENTVRVFELDWVTPEEVISVARPLMGIGEGEYTNEEGTIRIAVETFGTRMFVQGSNELVNQFEQIKEAIDVEFEGTEADADLPYVFVYEHRADPETVLSVMQTLLAGREDVRLDNDKTTGNLIARGRKDDHQLIQSTIDAMQRKPVEFAVIPVREYDPETMISLVRNVMNLDLEGMEGVGPTLEADPLRSQIVVRGTAQQVNEVKTIIAGLDPPRETGTDRSRTRVIPLTGREAQDAVDWAQTLWDSEGYGNRLNFVMPEERRGTIDQRDIQPLPRRGGVDGAGAGDAGEPGSTGTGGGDTAAPPNPKRDDTNDDITHVLHLLPPATKFGPAPRELPRAITTYVSLTRPIETQQESSSPRQQDEDRPPITVRVTPYGIILESDDLDALDRFEDLLFSRPMVDLPVLPTVFYLKNARADDAETLLESILGISGGGGGGGIGGLAGGLAQNLLGGPAGDIVGGLLGGDGGGGGGGSLAIETTGDVEVVADVRLNALIVKANAEDLQLIEELLSYIDQAEAPQEPNPDGKTYIIPIVYNDAASILNIVRNQLSDRIRSPQSGGGDQRQAAEQQFLQAILRGRGGRGGGGGGGEEIEEPKMAVALDERSNSILVTGPEYLYLQVKQITDQLDVPEIAQNESWSIIEVGGDVNMDVLRDALTNILGENLDDGGASNRSTTSGGSTQVGPGGRTSTDIQQSEAFRQLIQSRLQGGGFGGRGFPGGGGGRTFGGGGGGGFRPGGGGGRGR